MSALLRLHHVRMHYTLGEHEVPVLREVDLQVHPGERVAVIGPSGSGKTTLLLLVAGLESPSSGEIELDGVKLAGLDRDRLADLRRDRLGIVFQAFHLVPGLTALENVALPLEIAGRRDALAQARGWLDRVGLAARADHYPRQLSGGEQQRVAIARALVHDPALVLADEPTGNLDQQTRAGVVELLFELHRDAEHGMVLVTHDLAMARQCDRQLRLQDGCLHPVTDHPTTTEKSHVALHG